MGTLNTYDEADDEDDFIYFNFTARLLDTQPMANNRIFKIECNLTYSNTYIQANGTDVTAISPDTDNADFTWSVAMIQPENIQQDSTLMLSVDIGITESSTRFPDDVIIYYRVPYFSQLTAMQERKMIPVEYTSDETVGQYGVNFAFAKMRYGFSYRIAFNLTVDPDYSLQPGMGLKYISIPVDVSFKRESHTTPGVYDEFFLAMKTLTFSMDIPENIDHLGMDDNSVIKDCQITASSANNSANDVRPSGLGWISGENRGPPLYQNEFIQVSFASKIKFTAVTIYPLNAASLDRVTKFKVQYSRLGMRWEWALDAALEPAIFTVPWNNSHMSQDSAVTVNLGVSAFVAKHIRILPQENHEVKYTMKMRLELHGWSWPYPSSISPYTCPSNSGPSLRDYVERQMLAVPSTQEMYACTIPEPKSKPYCSGTDDFGVNWFAVDDNVLNVYGYDEDTSAVYALSRDQTACLRSKDAGHSWKQILCSAYDQIKQASEGNLAWTGATEIPFALNGDTTADLFNRYGTPLDSGNQVWSVSIKALHAYPVADSDISQKTDDDDQVAYWGNKVWAGP